MINKKNIEFVKRCLSEETRVYFLSEPIRVNTLYWAINTLFLMNQTFLIEQMSSGIEQFVFECQNEDGGFGGNIKYPSTPESTLAALQLVYLIGKNREKYLQEKKPEQKTKKDPLLKRPGEFSIQDRIDELTFLALNKDMAHQEQEPWNTSISEEDKTSNKDKKDNNDVSDDVTDHSKKKNNEKKKYSLNYVLCNAYLERIVTDQRLIGYNDQLDLRAICCYVSSKNVLAQLELGGPEYIIILPRIKSLICEYITRCNNLDGGLGAEPGCESHVAYTFCAIVSLVLIGEVSVLDIEKTCSWLARQQKKSGGFSGRVDKIEDLCNSYWAYSSLLLLGKAFYSDDNALRKYANQCYCQDTGGFADGPEKIPDLTHTIFAVGIVSMLDKIITVDTLPTLALCLFG
ncbi:geranylgeranyl transferase type-2 subunit beta [Nematocida sp. AWRm80]|nr:geranylgeranyl transferase type-2 subunit beta [Nematocida sp. AWRm80]